MVSVFRSHHRHRSAAAVRVRGGGDRRAGLAVGNPRRRDHPGRCPADRGPDQSRRPDPRRAAGLSRGARDPPAGPDRAEELVVSYRGTGGRRPRGRPSGSPGRGAAPPGRAWPPWRVVAILGYLPYVVYSGTTDLLVNVFILMSMASMWNLLAGYAGLVSVGQQAFIGLGAYFVLILAQHGTNPFVALPVAALGCGVIGLPVWWLVSRLRSGYFAIATWVVASVCELIIIRFPSLGGGTGAPLPGLSSLEPDPAHRLHLLGVPGRRGRRAAATCT